ncbi:Bacteriophage lambda head decoration protein D [Citrobacter amalonaticus]|nr:Bacteriophage lambda head decoration protein D [Citrobacter amalonaticus]
MPNEEFKHYQPLGNSDPAHTASAPGALTDSVPAMTPLMLDPAAGKLVVWDGAAAAQRQAFSRLTPIRTVLN